MADNAQAVRARQVAQTVAAVAMLAFGLTTVEAQTVTYTDARGVQHTTSSKEQIACERDQRGHYTLSGLCEGGGAPITTGSASSPAMVVPHVVGDPLHEWHGAEVQAARERERAQAKARRQQIQEQMERDRAARCAASDTQTQCYPDGRGGMQCTSTRPGCF